MSDGRIEVAEFKSGVEADAAASLLRASGIEVELAPIDPGGLRAFAHYPAPGRLLVAPSDADRARDLLGMAQSGAYENLEELPEVEAPPETPATPDEIDAGLRSLARLRTFTVFAAVAAMVGPVLAVGFGSKSPVVLLIAFVPWLVFFVARVRLHFARCPRCHVRFHGNWMNRGLPDACMSCGLKLP